jgi:hypothetical protein
VTYDQRVLDIAKENIMKSFSVVGLCERFEESLMLMANAFGWEIPYYENRKVSKVRPTLEPGVVNMIQEHNRLDMELYEFARKRFEDTLHKKEDVLRQALAALDSIPKPGPVQRFCYSTVGASRFLASKITSAL